VDLQIAVEVIEIKQAIAASAAVLSFDESHCAAHGKWM